MGQERGRNFQEATSCVDSGTWPVGRGFPTALGGRNSASLGEGPSQGFWRGESGDWSMCSCPGKTPFCLEQALTPLLTSSLSVPVFLASLTSLLCGAQETGSITGRGKQRGLFVQGLGVTKALNLGF